MMRGGSRRDAQIMTNAISNAAKLTTDGSVELVAQVRDGKFWFEVSHCPHPPLARYPVCVRA